MDAVDIVVDGSDRLETRYILNRCCVQQGIPYVYGAVFRDEGEFALFEVGNVRLLSMPSSDVDAAFEQARPVRRRGSWRRAGFHWDDAGE